MILLRHFLTITQAVFILLGFLSFNVYGSNIAAGNNLIIRATGDGTKGADGFATDGDVNVIGSNLSGKNVTVTGARDVNFESALNTSTENSTNKSSSANVGVSLGVSASGSFGLSVFANVAAGRGRATGNGTTHTETQVTATDNLTVNSGRDFNMTGAQARGDSIDVDVGRNLTITSEQDTNDYKSKQTNASAGVSIPIGVGTASVNVGVNQQKVNSTYTSVVEQSGLFAGNGGFDVNVKGHTQLNGGAIASTASSEFNTLTTGSLGYTDIENHAEYRATSSGVNVGTGSLLSNALKNATSALPMSGNQSDNDSSTTRSVISPATVTIAGQAATDAQFAGLSRDAASANDSLKPIFDLQQVQDDMALGQVVGEIGTQATGIIRTQMERDAYVANDQAMATTESKWKAADPTGYAQYLENPSAAALLDYEFNQKMNSDPAFAEKYGPTYYTTPQAERAAYVQSLTTQGVTFGGASTAAVNLHQVETEYGIGSPFGRAAQAITGLASGIAGGNISQGLSAAAAPYLASGIGKYFDDIEVGPDGKRYPTAETTAGRLLAHAAAGAAIAYASGNNAASGAIGAVSGEAMAMIVHQQLYDGKPTSELTQSERENIRAVATLASALVGGAAGGSFEDAATSASAGYNAAVNNASRAGNNATIQKGQSEAVQDCVAKGDYNCVAKLQEAGAFSGNDTYWRTNYNTALTNKRNMETAVRILNSCIKGGGSAESCAAKMKQNENGVRTLFTLLPWVGEGEAFKILFTGTDINGEEASRWWGAFGIVIAGYGQKARLLGKVDDALKAEVKATEKLAQQGDNAVHVARPVELSFDSASRTWTTPAGLNYGEGSIHGNRIKH